MAARKRTTAKPRGRRADLTKPPEAPRKRKKTTAAASVLRDALGFDPSKYLAALWDWLQFANSKTSARDPVGAMTSRPTKLQKMISAVNEVRAKLFHYDFHAIDERAQGVRGYGTELPDLGANGRPAGMRLLGWCEATLRAAGFDIRTLVEFEAAALGPTAIGLSSRQAAKRIDERIRRENARAGR